MSQAHRRPQILTKAQWPKVLLPWADLVKGVCLGGCVEDGDMGCMGLAHADVLAHTHLHAAYPRYGYLCFAQWRRPHTMVVLHELAHLITGEGHTRKWRRTVLELGGTLDSVPGWLGSYHVMARHGRRTS